MEFHHGAAALCAGRVNVTREESSSEEGYVRSPHNACAGHVSGPPGR